jgi:hypothetical protein
MSGPILVDSFPPCPQCGRLPSSASFRRQEGWFRVRTSALLRPCGHILSGEVAEMWAWVAMRGDQS